MSLQKPAICTCSRSRFWNFEGTFPKIWKRKPASCTKPFNWLRAAGLWVRLQLIIRRRAVSIYYARVYYVISIITRRRAVWVQLQLLTCRRAVSIEKCAHSTIILGAVEVALDLVRCESTTVIAACRRFTTMYACSAYPTLLFHNSFDLFFIHFYCFSWPAHIKYSTKFNETKQRD